MKDKEEMKHLARLDDNNLDFTSLKYLLLFTIFSLLFFPMVSAAQINFTKNSGNFDKGETLIAKVSGNFLEQITNENVLFYRGHVRIPAVYDIAKINSDYYIYAMLTGKTQGNYSVALEGVKYMDGIDVSEEDIVKNFTITENTADFSVEPGLVITENDFYLEVQNLQSGRITINVNSEFSSENSIALLSGEKKKINFNLNGKQGFTEIELSSEATDYSIPIYILSGSETFPEEREYGLEFKPDLVSISMATNSDKKRIVYLLNTKDDLEDIEIFITPLLENYVSVIPRSIDNLKTNFTEKIEIFIESSSEEMTLEGKITAVSENSTAEMTLVLDFVKDYISPEEETSENNTGEVDDEIILTTCVQLEGKICSQEQECRDDVVFTKDGKCCLTACQTKQEKSSSGKIIGWSLIILVVLLLFWFLIKYKRVRPKVDLVKPRRR